MTAPQKSRPDGTAGHRVADDGESLWPPNPRTVLLFCLAVMALAVPWAWWAVS